LYFLEIEISDRPNRCFAGRTLNPKARIITRAGQARYAQAMRNSGADEVIIPEYEGGLMTGRMIAKYYPAEHANLQ
jgi:hypothetical protein